MLSDVDNKPRVMRPPGKFNPREYHKDHFIYSTCEYVIEGAKCNRKGAIVYLKEIGFSEFDANEYLDRLIADRIRQRS